MGEPLEDATESDNKKVALVIAVLALFLAFAEAGAKYAEHHSTEVNIERSDLFAFYQAKKIRQTVIETAAQNAEAGVGDGKPSDALEKQIASWKDKAAAFEKDPKKPKDGLDAILEQAKAAHEERELLNRKLEHFEYSAGALQIAIVLASGSIITGMVVLAWLAGGLGLVGAALLAFGYFAPTVLPFFGG